MKHTIHSTLDHERLEVLFDGAPCSLLCTYRTHTGFYNAVYVGDHSQDVVIEQDGKAAIVGLFSTEKTCAKQLLDYMEATISKTDGFEYYLQSDLLYDLGDELIAVITENEVLYKEDFAALMKENGMKAAEALWEKVWYQFSKDFPAAGLSLRAQAQASIDKVCTCLTQESALDPATLKPSLKKTIQNAEARAGDTKKPTAERDSCRDDSTPPER